jgi:hypothetical protein
MGEDVKGSDITIRNTTSFLRPYHARDKWHCSASQKNGAEKEPTFLL